MVFPVSRFCLFSQNSVTNGSVSVSFLLSILKLIVGKNVKCIKLLSLSCTALTRVMDFSTFGMNLISFFPLFPLE